MKSGLIGFGISNDQYWNFQIVLFLIGLCGQAMGFVVGSCCQKTHIAALLAPLVVAPFLLFTSYALSDTVIPFYFLPLKWLSPFWYAFNALVINEFTSLPLFCLPSQLIYVPAPLDLGVIAVCRYTTGLQVLETYHIGIEESFRQASGYRSNVWILLFVCLFFFILAGTCLQILAFRVSKKMRY